MRDRAWRRAMASKHKVRNLKSCKAIFPKATGSVDDVINYLNEANFAADFAAGMGSPFQKEPMSPKEPYLRYKKKRELPPDMEV